MYPWSVNVQGLLIHTQDGDTIIYAGNIRAAFRLFGLLKKKIILPSVSLVKARVNFTRYSAAEDLNISEAFLKKKNPNQKTRIIKRVHGRSLSSS